MITKTRGRRPIKEITDPQSRTLREIHRFLQQRGFPPTMKDLAAILDIAHSSAHAQVGQLVKKGFMTRERKKLVGWLLPPKVWKRSCTEKGKELTVPWDTSG